MTLEDFAVVISEKIAIPWSEYIAAEIYISWQLHVVLEVVWNGQVLTYAHLPCLLQATNIGTAAFDKCLLQSISYICLQSENRKQNFIIKHEKTFAEHGLK